MSERTTSTGSLHNILQDIDKLAGQSDGGSPVTVGSDWKQLYNNMTTDVQSHIGHLERSNTAVLPVLDRIVKLKPSHDVSLPLSAQNEIVDAIIMFKSLWQLRKKFVQTFPETPSPSIRYPTAEERELSTQPIAEPNRAPTPSKCAATFHFEEGVCRVQWPGSGLEKLPTIPDIKTFLRALKDVMHAAGNPACKSFAFGRLRYLEQKFSMHLMFNSTAELEETKGYLHRDFYNVRKVDTHVHHSACMHQKHLLRFIRKKFRTEADRVVAVREGKEYCLRDIFTDMGIPDAWNTSVDHLNVHALGTCFQRFDRFNSKYNPFGQKLLREVFLKTDNYINGEYLADLTKEVMHDLEEQKYQFVEWRVSIYGRNRDEWLRLAQWFDAHKIVSQQVRWLIQIPRLFHVYKKMNELDNFGEFLRNVFEPLFEAIIDPESHPLVFRLLQQVVGWDCVDDESVVSFYTSEGIDLPPPDQYRHEHNPPYSYYGYYLYANITALNQLLHLRGMKPFYFRPHCGETGNVSHLACMYLVAHGINHGIMLRKTPVLQYLYYLAQIGLAVSPLSNNALFQDITKNPFNTFFRIGLNVSLSTDDPLMFHFTDEPLLEEYSCCAHVWKLSPVDLCEIARHSVLQSGFENELKNHWVSPSHHLLGPAGNCPLKTNVSNLRLEYREDSLREERKFLKSVVRQASKKKST